jgi:hypothetical protein
MIRAARRAASPSTYVRPRLYPKQAEAIFCPQRYGIVEASTKSGKSAGAFCWLFEQALQAPHVGARYYWVAPWYKTARIMFDRAIGPMRLPAGLYTANKSDMSITLRRNGAVIEFRSAEKPDALFGDDVQAAVLDEMTRMRPEAWHAIRSTLTATQGPVRMIGNVKGRRNWAFLLAQDVRAGKLKETGRWHYAKLTAYDAVDGGVLAASEVEDARLTLPDHVFRELYLAEPTEDGACPFKPQYRPLSTKAPVAWGWDLGKAVDFTWGIGLDEDGLVCRSHRWQRVAWPRTVERIVALTLDVPALVDSTGLGDPVLDQVQQRQQELLHRGGNFEGFKFTAPSKQQIMEGLALGLETPNVYGVACGCEGLECPHCQLRLELEGFEYEATRNGARYSAPAGMHDDGVCSLALAYAKWSALKKMGSVALW